MHQLSIIMHGDDHAMDNITELRYYHFMAGMLANQQHDPLCSICKAFTNTALKVQEELKAYSMTHAADLPTLPEKEAIMLADIKMMLADLHPVADAAGQKKAGNCMLPQGVCFVKSSKGLIERICS